jgi:hypothetical protein
MTPLFPAQIMDAKHFQTRAIANYTNYGKKEIIIRKI